MSDFYRLQTKSAAASPLWMKAAAQSADVLTVCLLRQANLAIPLEEPSAAVGKVGLHLTLHLAALLLASTGKDVLGHELGGVGLSHGKAHEVVVAITLKGQLQRILVEQETVDEHLLLGYELPTFLQVGLDGVVDECIAVVQRCPS